MKNYNKQILITLLQGKYQVNGEPICNLPLYYQTDSIFENILSDFINKENPDKYYLTNLLKEYRLLVDEGIFKNIYSNLKAERKQYLKNKELGFNFEEQDDYHSLTTSEILEFFIKNKNILKDIDNELSNLKHTNI